MFRKNLLLLLSTVLLTLGACSSEEADKIPTSQVKKIRSGPTGLDYPEAVMVSKEYKPFWKEHVVTGYPRNPHALTPAKLAMLKQDRSCKLKQPGDYEVVTKIAIDGGTQDTNIRSWSDEDLEKATKEFVKRYKNNSEEAALRRAYTGRSMGLVNVYVTDESAPNHLILSSRDNILWNLNIGGKAKISNITLISNGLVGVVNVPDNKYTRIQSMTAEKAKRCGVDFWPRPNEDWDIVKKLKKNPGTFGDIVEKHQRHHAIFNKWYRNTFDENSDANAIVASTAANILAGPIPRSLDNRIKYQSIQDKTVYIAGKRSVMIADKKQYKEYVRGVIVENVKKLVGPDLNVLKPGS